MKTSVMLFAAAKQLVGSSQVEIELSSELEPTIANLKLAMGRAFPQLQTLLERSCFAIDSEWAENHAMISEGSQVAMIPPVSGG
jgi:molybdopterin converting factor small subunit